MNFRLCLLAAATILAPAAAHAGTQFVQNGNFSTTTTTSNDGNFELTSGNTYGSVANWSTAGGYNLLYTPVSAAAAAPSASDAMTSANSAYGQYSTGAGNNNEYISSPSLVSSPVGGNFLALDGDPSFAAAVTQNLVGLTQGTLYQLDFYWAAAQLASRNGPTTESLQVSFGNTTKTTNVVNNAAGGFTGWVKQTYYFTAASSTQLLSFLSVGTPSGLPPIALLDGVSVTAAPEPSTLAVLATGIGALAFFSRRRAPKSRAA